MTEALAEELVNLPNFNRTKAGRDVESKPNVLVKGIIHIIQLLYKTLCTPCFIHCEKLKNKLRYMF